ncbi:MAG: glycosyltransferase [Mucinivorans sp.]
MKIAFIIPSLINKGPIIVVDTIIRHLTDKVEQIDVFYFDDKFGVDFNCATHKINFNQPIDFDEYDIIHSHMYRPDKYIHRWKSKIKKAKVVSTIHQDIFQNLKFSYNFFIAVIFSHLWKRNLMTMDSVAIISQKLFSLYHIQIPKSTIVYNGIDIDYKPELADQSIISQIDKLRNNGYKIAGTYAAINKRKGIDQLISLLDIRDDIALVIIGEGTEKERLKKVINKKNLNNRALFLPYLKHPYNYLSHFDVYVMPSRSEGFGLALAEAALTHTPVVCSNIDVFHEIFDDSEASFFELENTISLSNAIDKALTTSTEKTDNAYNRIQSNFTGHIMADNYLSFYKQVL